MDFVIPVKGWDLFLLFVERSGWGIGLLRKLR